MGAFGALRRACATDGRTPANRRKLRKSGTASSGPDSTYSKRKSQGARGGSRESTTHPPLGPRQSPLRRQLTTVTAGASEERRR